MCWAARLRVGSSHLRGVTAGVASGRAQAVGSATEAIAFEDEDEEWIPATEVYWMGEVRHKLRTQPCARPRLCRSPTARSPRAQCSGDSIRFLPHLPHLFSGQLQILRRKGSSELVVARRCVVVCQDAGGGDVTTLVSGCGRSSCMGARCPSLVVEWRFGGRRWWCWAADGDAGRQETW